LQSNGLTAASTSGEVHAEISRSMVRLYKEYYGKGPTKARTYSSGDLLVCLLDDGLLTGERTLRDAGREALVSEQRGQLQSVLRQRCIETVEGITGRTVVTFISGVDLHTETSAELFLLAPESEPDALAAWPVHARDAQLR
jgi:uncharacterized protein YbcI